MSKLVKRKFEFETNLKDIKVGELAIGEGTVSVKVDAVLSAEAEMMFAEQLGKVFGELSSSLKK